jgi:hypothetical protein
MAKGTPNGSSIITSSSLIFGLSFDEGYPTPDSGPATTGL